MIDPDKLVDMIRNKEPLIRKMLDMMTRNQQQHEGCIKLRESITRKENPNHTEANLVRCLDVALAVSAKNSQDLLDLAQVMLVYTSSSTFTTDVSSMANKLGKGEEALQAMMENKMKGK